MTCYSIPLTGHTQAGNTFFIGDDEKSIISINQIIAETEIMALENTKIEVIQAEPWQRKNTSKLLNKTLLPSFHN